VNWSFIIYYWHKFSFILSDIISIVIQWHESSIMVTSWKHDGYFHLYVPRVNATITYVSVEDSEVIYIYIKYRIFCFWYRLSKIVHTAIPTDDNLLLAQIFFYSFRYYFHCYPMTRIINHGHKLCQKMLFNIFTV
jgi:hypothetical protein